MRALVQRVSEARVIVAGDVAGEVTGEVTGEIGPGLLVYLAVAPLDTPAEAAWLAAKVAALRVFEDEGGKLNLSVRDVAEAAAAAGSSGQGKRDHDARDARGSVLVVSNFTLLADARKGRRPSFMGAAAAHLAEPLTRAFVEALRGEGLSVATGVFGADMRIDSRATGPVNVIVDTPADAARE